MKKLLLLITLMFVTFTLASCSKKYTVTFNTDGGTEVAAQEVKKNKTATEPTAPTKEGFTFVEWQLDGNKYDFASKVKEDITLVAKWEASQFVVTFDSNGGSAVASQTIQKGGQATKPANPGKAGYAFVEWQLNNTTFDFNTAINSNITLTAAWREESAYNVQIALTSNAQSDDVKKGDTVKFTVKVVGSQDTTYKYVISDEKLVKVENDVMTVIADVKVDKYVTVTVVSNADNTAKDSITFKIVAPIVEGAVGELTSEMIAELGNPNITVEGTLTDIYKNFQMDIYSYSNSYDMVVKMSEGAWYGEWYHQLAPNNVVTDNYRKGSQDGLRDQYGNVGHGLEKVFVDKDNQASSALVKDYISIPAIWEAQHLWNHLGSLDVNKFVYDIENDVYEYTYDAKDEEELFLLTYLSYSLTPLLADTLVKVQFKIEDGKITKFIGQTEIINYYGSDETKPDAMEYTTIELVFSEIGTTVVPEPQPFEAPEYVEKLEAALNKMKSATNYTFRASDTQTHAPSIDAGDYEITTTSTNNVAKRSLVRTSAISNAYKNFVSSVGQLGTVGYVTEDAVILAETGQYSASMDGNNYHTEYSGYKQVEEDYFDYFEYSSEANALVGKKRIKGNIFDVMPSFEMSPNIFRFVEQRTLQGGKKVYYFELRDTTITRDVAIEVSAYDYADDAKATTDTVFEIVVDENGNLISTKYPYSLVSGTYMGYCYTTYGNVGTTTLEENWDASYVKRQVKETWADYDIMYYSSTFTGPWEDVTADVAIKAIYGDAAELFPAPSVFMEIFGDNINGPFFNYKEKGTDADGNKIYKGYININVTSSEYDENMQITNFEEIVEELTLALTAEGFTISQANTDLSGGASGRANRYICFIKDDIQIVIENNFTRYIWVYFYETGEWSLKR